MYPGDEDNGSMGAWFIFNMLGLYPLSPGSDEYVLGSPLFANVTLDVGAAVPLTVQAKNQAPQNVYVLESARGGGCGGQVRRSDAGRCAPVCDD